MQDGEVRSGICRDDLGGDLITVTELDGDVGRAVDDVIVGDDVAVAGQHEPAAGGLALDLAPKMSVWAIESWIDTIDGSALSPRSLIVFGVAAIAAGTLALPAEPLAGPSSSAATATMAPATTAPTTAPSATPAMNRRAPRGGRRGASRGAGGGGGGWGSFDSSSTWGVMTSVMVLSPRWDVVAARVRSRR